MSERENVLRHVYMENTEGSRSAFYSISLLEQVRSPMAVVGFGVEVTFGKIGTKGAKLVHKHGTLASADDNFARLLKAKMAKGYRTHAQKLLSPQEVTQKADESEYQKGKDNAEW